MEWVHCHIARKPAPPKGAIEEVPAQLAAILMKLIAKTPKRRYQTAAGVERDLRRCLDDWERRGAIAEFPPGERDHSDRLRIPEKLCGREREIQTLIAAFDAAVANARPQLVLRQRLLRHRKVLGRERAAPSAGPAARVVRLRQVRSTEARCSVCDPGPGLPKSDTPASRQAGSSSPNGASSCVRR